MAATSVIARRRVLQVITAFSSDAPAQSAAVLAKYLDRDRFDVRAVSLRPVSGHASTAAADLAAAGIPHMSLGMRGFGDLTAVWRLWRLLGTWRPDIVHSHAFRADVWCGITGRLAGVPLVVCTIRNHDTEILRAEHPGLIGRVAARLSRISTRLSHRVIAVSDGVAEYLVTAHGVPRDKVSVVRNGFDFARLADDVGDRAAVRARMGWRDDEIVIGTLAILKARKGLSYLVEAARAVVDAHPAARFFIAGDGPDRPMLEAEIERLGLDGRVMLLGHRSDPLALLHASDIYALPSLFEGLPRSLLEAMALGKPVVVTDIGGSREVVAHEESGFVVPPRDAARLARALSALVASAELRLAFGRAGRLVIEAQFDARGTAAAHERIYNRDLPAT